MDTNNNPVTPACCSRQLPAHDLRPCAGILLLIVFLCVSSCARQPVYPEPLRSGSDVYVDISGVRENAPQFYTYHLNGRNINFFVMKIDGRIVSFLDACRKCHRKKLGFRFDQDSFICRACDERYPMSEIEKGFGSCYPIQLQGRTEGGKYYISVPVLEKTAIKYFS